jgi:crotonobetainyl-CoA:carnitine CoA-transferase CaiB-like acyl-CoA transferase
VEQLMFQYWFDDVLPYPKVAERQGSLHWIRAYKVVPALAGWEMITPTPNAPGLLAWMVEEGFPEALELAAKPLAELIGDLDKVMEVVAAFAATRDAGELFREAQARHIAFAEVQTVAQVAANPQHDYRGFFRKVDWDGPTVVLPGPVARFGRTPSPPPLPPQDLSTQQVDSFPGECWPQRSPSAPRRGQQAKPLAGLRVLDLSHVLAGPMCTRLLGDLGAEVIKVQTLERATTVNDPTHPYFYTWNRSKRAVTLNMKHGGAAEVMRKLISASDVLIENFSAGVLDRWGLSYQQATEWNPRLVYVTMSGCGHSGPWSNLVTYAPTIHALCGLTYLTNPPGRGDIGPGFSLNDPAAGLSAAFAILAALDERDRSGMGQQVDISQMETGGYLIGPALVDFLTNGREAHPAGNLDFLESMVPNECYRSADGVWLAVSCRDDADWARLVSATGLDAEDTLAIYAQRAAHRAEVDALLTGWVGSQNAARAEQILQDGGVPAGRVQTAGDLMSDPQLIARGMWSSF